MGKPIIPEARKIGNRVARRSAELNMNQRELSIQADIPYQTICEIIAGKRMPKTDTLVKLAKALRTPVNCLLTDEPEIPPDLLTLNDRMKQLPDHIRNTMMRMFIAQIDSLQQKFTPT